ncbi:hypothetical protein O181_018009 [Austropuccinia psidii MF-1]|uniref:Reverse transcriptase RNase H-like domain-containing protein n=1 Tax=Austropuccinia psidii MF-1 TaxID=1389203 RepID=A0A9Q3C6U3_9BASI|nr:hypothetical protein [Austropuccinia psidii MF-1]
MVETDAADYALGSVLSQFSHSGKHPIAFNSHKLCPADLKYEINDKELLGIVWVLKRWRAFLLSLYSSFDNSFHQRFSLSIKPAGLNFSLNSISQSLTTLDAWLPFQMHCHVGKMFTQRGGEISSERMQ